MNPHITVITLGVDDLERAFAFYKNGLGLTSKGIIGFKIPMVIYGKSSGIPILLIYKDTK